MSFDKGSRGKCGRDSFECGAALKPEFYGVSTASPTSGPFCQGSINAADRIYARCSKVVRLLYRRCPSAVPRLIASIVVNSVNGHSGRAFAHRLKKLGEIVAPFIAYGYSSPPPQVISWVFCVVTPVFHVSPYAIGFRLAQSVRAHGLRRNFFLQTSARHCMAAAEFCRSNKRFGSAVANAYPSTLSISARAYCWRPFALNNQFSISFSG